MRSQELRVLSDKELAQALEDAHRALMNVRFRVATRQLADVSQIQKSRRDVARVRTVLRERELVKG